MCVSEWVCVWLVISLECVSVCGRVWVLDGEKERENVCVWLVMCMNAWVSVNSCKCVCVCVLAWECARWIERESVCVCVREMKVFFPIVWHLFPFLSTAKNFKFVTSQDFRGFFEKNFFMCEENFLLFLNRERHFVGDYKTWWLLFEINVQSHDY